MPSDEEASRIASRAEAVRRELLAAFPSQPRQRGYWTNRGLDRALRDVPIVLADDETIEMASVGTIDGRGVLIVGTNRRLVVFDHGYARRTFYDYAYADVDKVEWRKGLRSGEVAVIPRSGIGVRVRNVVGGHVKPLGQWLTRRVADARATDRR